MSISSLQLISYFKNQINQLRGNPQKLIKHLEGRKFLNNNEFAHSEIPNIHYKTLEGKQAVDQAIGYLKSAKPVNQLVLAEEICEIAYKVGLKIHHLREVQDPYKFLDEEIYNSGLQNIGQTQIIVEYGFREDPQILPSLVVSDGDKNRGSRNILMDGKYKFLGISVHQHQQYDYVLIFIFNTNLKLKESCSCSIF